MNSDSINTGLSNPYSSGGGGVTFEQLVGTSYLVSLLVGDIPRGLASGITNMVQFQHRWAGSLLDDIVITSSDGVKERKIAIQVKHSLVFSDSDSNSTFLRVIEDCWKTFDSSLGWQFDKNLDRIGIAVGIYEQKIDKHFHPIIQWARTSINADEFIQKVSLKKFSSKEKQDFLATIRNLLTKAKGNDISDEEVWQFLKCCMSSKRIGLTDALN